MYVTACIHFRFPETKLLVFLLRLVYSYMQECTVPLVSNIQTDFLTDRTNFERMASGLLLLLVAALVDKQKYIVTSYILGMLSIPNVVRVFAHVYNYCTVDYMCCCRVECLCLYL